MKNRRFWAQIALFLAFLEAAFMVAVAVFIVTWNPHLHWNDSLSSLLLLMVVLGGSILAFISFSRFIDGQV